MGPVITPESKNRITDLIELGISEGANALLDGRKTKVSGYEEGNFLAPTLLENVPLAKQLIKTEIFGPVMSLISMKTIEEAIAFVNSGQYGNMACLFTSNGASARKFRNEADAGNIGINIGANKDSIGQKRVDDYIECFQKVAAYADYISVNISSPNTPGLRSLHSKENFLPLFKAISHVRETENFSNPIFIKLSPDEHIDVISEITKAIKEFNFDGVITSNTTIDKSNLIFESKADLSGGLSGKPLLEKSNELLSLVHSRESELLKIGVGGVHNKESFDMKFEKGASLVQIYTSFIYHGPKIIKKLLN